MKPFRERNPVIIGAISLAVIAVLILAAFRAQDLPMIGGGDTYTAAFSEAGGLKADDPVRIAGVRVGKVESIELEGDHVKVTFRVKTDSEFGAETGAAIRVNTLLGAMYLALEPAGNGQLDSGKEIPVERTSSPYDVVEAFSGLAETADQIDTDQLAQLADDAVRPDPQHARGVQGGAVRRLAALGQHRRQERADQPAAHQPAAGLHGAQRPRRRHHRPDEAVRHPLPGAGRPARGGAQPAGVDLDAVQRAERAGPAEPRRTSSRR